MRQDENEPEPAMRCIASGCSVDAVTVDRLCSAHDRAFTRACSHAKSCTCADCDVHDAVIAHEAARGMVGCAS